MKAQGWAVVGPDGKVILDTIRSSSGEVLAYFATRIEGSWSAFEATGYRCIPVTIEGRE